MTDDRSGVGIRLDRAGVDMILCVIEQDLIDLLQVESADFQRRVH